MSFEGSCHCGAVKFKVQAPIPSSAISCNCSHCRRKGFLLAFFPVTQLIWMRCRYNGMTALKRRAQFRAMMGRVSEIGDRSQ